MDVFEKCSCYTAAKEAILAGYYPYFIPLTETEGSEAVFRGRRLIMCGSNNYLGLIPRSARQQLKPSNDSGRVVPAHAS